MKRVEIVVRAKSDEIADFWSGVKKK